MAMIQQSTSRTDGIFLHRGLTGGREREFAAPLAPRFYRKLTYQWYKMFYSCI